MAFSSVALRCCCIEDLLERVAKLRRREMTIDTSNFTILLPTDKHAWAKVFVEYFLSNVHCTLPRCGFQAADDMLWYVQAPGGGYVYSSGHVSKARPTLEVFRRQSKKQPSPGSKSISWEETVYLNLILHHVEYTLTCAVCTKTSPHNLQILKKNTQRIFASPSRRRMDISKGESEELAYPLIYFCIDDYQQVFEDIVVRDGECVCVELSARDRTHKNESVVFLGSIRYEVLRQVYDTKGSSAWQWAQKLVYNSGAGRVEFVRMKGPRGKGFAEMAVRQTCDPSYSMTNSMLVNPADPSAASSSQNEQEEALQQAANEYQQRRMSDTNLASKHSSHHRNSSFSWKAVPIKKSQSEADTSSHYPEVEANSLDDEFEESAFARLWNVRGFGQAWHWLREKRRATCIPLNALLTYVTLPWTSIVEDLFDTPIRPILTFDVDIPNP